MVRNMKKIYLGTLSYSLLEVDPEIRQFIAPINTHISKSANINTNIEFAEHYAEIADYEIDCESIDELILQKKKFIFPISFANSAIFLKQNVFDYIPSNLLECQKNGMCVCLL